MNVTEWLVIGIISVGVAAVIYVERRQRTPTVKCLLDVYECEPGRGGRKLVEEVYEKYAKSNAPVAFAGMRVPEHEDRTTPAFHFYQQAERAQFMRRIASQRDFVEPPRIVYVYRSVMSDLAFALVDVLHDRMSDADWQALVAKTYDGDAREDVFVGALAAAFDDRNDMRQRLSVSLFYPTTEMSDYTRALLVLYACLDDERAPIIYYWSRLTDARYRIEKARAAVRDWPLASKLPASLTNRLRQ